MTYRKASVRQKHRNGETGWVTTVTDGTSSRCAWFKCWRNAVDLATVATRNPDHFVLGLIHWELVEAQETALADH